VTLSRAPKIRAVGVVSPAKLAGVALIARVSGNSRLGSHRALASVAPSRANGGQDFDPRGRRRPLSVEQAGEQRAGGPDIHQRRRSQRLRHDRLIERLPQQRGVRGRWVFVVGKSERGVDDNHRGDLRSPASGRHEWGIGGRLKRCSRRPRVTTDSRW
jgi:hypothetical protein